MSEMLMEPDYSLIVWPTFNNNHYLIAAVFYMAVENPPLVACLGTECKFVY